MTMLDMSHRRYRSNQQDPGRPVRSRFHYPESRIAGIFDAVGIVDGMMQSGNEDAGFPTL